MEKIEVNLDEIEHLTQKALICHGASNWIAKSVAKAVRTAEAKGNLICGLYCLESYCSQLITGTYCFITKNCICICRRSVWICSSSF